MTTKTKGVEPTVPVPQSFLEVSAGSVTLHLNAWVDGGCPILYFVVEYKPRNHLDWTLVSNSVKAGGNFVVLDLNPATWYNLKVTAHNNAGFSVAEYEFATLTVTGGKVHAHLQQHAFRIFFAFPPLPWFIFGLYVTASRLHITGNDRKQIIQGMGLHFLSDF